MKTDKQLRRLCVNHWKRMLKLSVEDIKDNEEAPSAYSCAFCNAFTHANGRINCLICPVYGNTGKTYCKGTPYYAASDLYQNIKNGDNKRLSTFYKLVQKEIDFLESLEC